MSSEPPRQGLDYRSAGVDIDAAEDALDRIKPAIRATFGRRVVADVGSFGGLFRADDLGREPVLVATTDGVGTKTRIAAASGRFDTVGRDLVQHCINDALVQGAEPLFFLDYVGVGRLRPERVAALIGGVAAACRDHGVALLGGETAEMPGVYPEDEFDLVGTLVGVVEREAVIDGGRVEAGDVLIGLPSVGLHTNGYSLARRIVEERMGLGWDDPFPGAAGATAAEVLLAPHACYLEALRPFLRDPALHALAHITGGGLAGNLPRVLNGLGARVARSAVPPLNVFEQLVAAGGVERDEAWRAFNMGVGMVLVVAAEEADRIEADLAEADRRPFRLGEVTGPGPGVSWLD
ncbi:MAG: phosphoribosylformylglycinamidine cyclo-ligase [Planctomycetota bacterium]|nr:MAG: phosphoribosylformylglycinamidine cyclo-ligase [Planctomycetota bacterium]